MKGVFFSLIIIIIINFFSCITYYNPFISSSYNDPESNSDNNSLSSIIISSSSSISSVTSVSSESSISSTSSSSSALSASNSSSVLSSVSSSAISSSFSSMSFGSTETIGFAFIAGYNVSTTTGGEGGSEYHIYSSNISDFTLNADTVLPKTFYIYGSISLAGMQEIGSNTTIIGVGSDAEITGYGLSINSGDGTNPPETNPNAKNNIIIRNIQFTSPEAYALYIVGGSHHIWIDHCTFSNPVSSNSMIEIKKTSDFITISWCVFTNTNSSVTNTYMLSIGDKPVSSSSSSASSSSAFMEENHLKVTFHHNFFKDDVKLTGNHPRARYGMVHVLNNYYLGNSTEKTDGIASNYYAKVYAEGNYMNYIDWPSILGHNGEVPGELVALNNELYNYDADFITAGSAFIPSSYYSYTPDTAADIPSIIINFAGSGKL